MIYNYSHEILYKRTNTSSFCELTKYVIKHSSLYQELALFIILFLLPLSAILSVIILLSGSKKKKDDLSTKEKEKQERTIYDIIKTANYSQSIGKYKVNLIIGRESIWNHLGDKLSLNESKLYDRIPFNSFYTVRMDGINFSSVLKQMRKDGTIESGYSLKFEKAMIATATELLNITERSLCVFTQSDEITLLVDKCKLGVDGNYIIPEKNRRYVKYLSTFASRVTAIFNKHLNKELESKNNTRMLAFDARIGVYDNFNDAFELLLWRSYDCSVNGISSGLIMNKIGKHQNYNSGQKLNLLEERGLLDKMTDHQLYGTFIIKGCSSDHIVTRSKDVIFMNEHLSSIVKEDIENKKKYLPLLNSD